jgi:hypothetical protein
MSALGIWNNRYEGGPCYAACMETFTLYSLAYLATTPPSPSAGRDATTPRDESTPIRVGPKRRGCARDSRRNQWQCSRANLNPSLIWESTPRCFQPSLKIFTERASQVSADRDIDLSIKSLMKLGINKLYWVIILYKRGMKYFVWGWSCSINVMILVAVINKRLQIILSLCIKSGNQCWLILCSKADAPTCECRSNENQLSNSLLLSNSLIQKYEADLIYMMILNSCR